MLTNSDKPSHSYTFALVLLIPYSQTIFKRRLAAAPIRPHDCIRECPPAVLRQKLKTGGPPFGDAGVELRMLNWVPCMILETGTFPVFHKQVDVVAHPTEFPCLAAI